MSARTQKLRLRISAIRGILDEVERMLDQEEGAKVVLAKNKKKPAKTVAKKKVKAAHQIDIEELLSPESRGRNRRKAGKARPLRAKKVRHSKAKKRTKKVTPKKVAQRGRGKPPAR